MYVYIGKCISCIWLDSLDSVYSNTTQYLQTEISGCRLHSTSLI